MGFSKAVLFALPITSGNRNLAFYLARLTSWVKKHVTCLGILVQLLTVSVLKLVRCTSPYLDFSIISSVGWTSICLHFLLQMRILTSLKSTADPDVKALIDLTGCI